MTISSQPPAPPPFPPSPPPPIYPSPAPRRRHGWMIFSLVLMGLLLLLGLFWIGTLFNGAGLPGARHRAGPELQETLLESAPTANKILLVRMDGIISSDRAGREFGLPGLIREQLDRAMEDDRVKAVILRVDSPGGEVLASDEIYKAIERFQKDSGKPVVASMQNVAASGGYYVAAPCRWIVANELTITGSIGVIMHSYNYRGLMDKVGLRPEVYKSGKFKDMLSGDRPPSEVSPEEREMVQKLVDTTFERFKKVVRDGRQHAAAANKSLAEAGRSLAGNWEDYADGRILSGNQAFELGLVDELGDLETAKARARQLAGIQAASVVEYQPLFNLGSFLRMLGRAPVQRIEVKWGAELPQLKAGRLYFLAPSFMQ